MYRVDLLKDQGGEIFIRNFGNIGVVVSGVFAFFWQGERIHVKLGLENKLRE
jgi:hypothetical protein